ncbi:GNAT family N-acetyltransferase [Halobacillus sp. ACCC02827]|uniref:GNAT family N-acetyltransferase n=1 Tax=unclassified Halobacillus TaxID=2636472 RepID=UPI0007863AAC|nr:MULTISPECIES: GNAT family N-acetyltransferase [unclassified Halobacillus]WJE16881.1 GNAT family N-acetyltransferase [Halobacillus sp. ACCC02827]
MDIVKVTKDSQRQDAYYVRRTVFVEEQHVPEELEIDELEESAIHFVGYESGEPVAASRLRFVNGYGKLERICVMKDQRGRSYGRKMIEEMEAVTREYAYDKAKLNAQTQAEKFYESLGYVTISGEFMDAGIPHVTMVKKLS